MAHDADCIIIGAGFAGLSAASHLSGSASVLVLEARPRLGGRAYTYDMKVGAVDLGAHFIHGYKEGNPMGDVAKRLGVDVHFESGNKTVVVGKDGPIDPSSDFSALGSAQTGLKSSSPPSSASVASSLLSQLSSASRALARTSEIGAGVTLEQLSARYSSFARPYAGTDAAPIGGYKQVVEKLWEATEARGNAKVKLEEEVKSIKDEEDGVTVQTSKATYRAKTVICTIPLAVLQAAPPTFSPPLESPLQAAIKRTQVGLLDKVILVYDEPWWDAQTGTFILLPEDETEQPRQTDGLGTMLKRTTVVVDNLHKTAASKLPALLVPLGATAAHVVERHSDDQVVSTVHKFLAKRIGGSASEPKETLVVRWGADPYARGATSAPVCLAPGVDAADQPTPLDFVQLSRSQWDGRLGFAGEHTDFDHRGSVVGALLSGEREAKRVLGLLTRSNETAKL